MVAGEMEEMTFPSFFADTLTRCSNQEWNVLAAIAQGRYGNREKRSAETRGPRETVLS
jgi:hypothetical protein